MSLKRKYGDYLFISKRSLKSGGGKEKKPKKADSSDDESEGGGNPLMKLSSRDEKIERYDNHIYFYSEVSRDSIFELNVLIKEVEEENILTAHKLNIEEIPIYLHINSYGGSVFNGFAAIDVIQSCKVPIYTIIEGCAASAATLMSIVAKKRYIRPNAYMLIHQLSSGCWGKMNEIEDEYENLKELMNNIKRIYTENAKIPKKELGEVLKHDLWWNPDKCMSLGLVDELWTGK
jgi:ATP-dependent Clp endopeptidase proteolytic subunit ClpP